MSRVVRACLSFAAFAIAIASGGLHAAEQWPARPVTIVVPFGPGSVTDSTVRIIAQQLELELHQTFIVENRAGAGGTIAGAYVARAEPDGYTLMMGSNSANSAVRALIKNVPYDPLNDFKPIACLVGYPSVLAVNPDLPVRSLTDFIAYAKSHPGKLEYGYGNSSGRIGGEMIKEKAGIAMERVAYRSTPQGITDLMAGHIKAMVTDFNTALPQVRANKIRALAVFTTERSALLPDVPTVSESLAPGFDLMAWSGLMGPAHMPDAVAQTMGPALEKIIEKPAVRDQLAAQGTAVWFVGPAEMPAFMRQQAERWTSLVKGAGIEPE